MSTTLKGLKAMRLKESYQAGEKVDVPHLCVSSAQAERVASRPIIYRECFDAILDRVAAELDHSAIFFEDERPIYVHGPKGKCSNSGPSFDVSSGSSTFSMDRNR